tara:strand:- start:848 stop:1303 length:456 start_codon:yes stop_codon:yes gene_type:complete
MNKFITILVSLAFYCSNAMAIDTELEHANKISNIAQEQMLFVLEKYGNKLKAKAMLDACELSELSNSIKISNDEILSDLALEYHKLPNHQKLDRDSISLMAISNVMRTTYMYGFMSATRTHVNSDPNFCMTAIKFAEQIMVEERTNTKKKP